jgi:hypothetical protein
LRPIHTAIAQALNNGTYGVIELENGPGGDQVEEAAAAASKLVELAQAAGAGSDSQSVHFSTSGWSHLI